MRIVETKDLTKIFTTRQKKGNIIALDSVSLGVDQGEVFGLLGPNGAGKTTLVKTLMGLTSITSGDALVNGLPPGNPGSRQQVGFLPENPRFPSHLTGRALLVFSGRLSGVSDDDINSRLKPLLVLVGMERWADTKVSKYSKGMTQRIGVAQRLEFHPANLSHKNDVKQVITLTNRTETDLSMIMIEYGPELKLDIPESIQAKQTALVQVAIADYFLEDDFESSFTLEFTGNSNESFRVSIPVVAGDFSFRPNFTTTKQ